MSESKSYVYYYNCEIDGDKQKTSEFHRLKNSLGLFKSGYQKKFDGTDTKEKFYDNHYSSQGTLLVQGKSKNGNNWVVKEVENDISKTYELDYNFNQYFHNHNPTCKKSDKKHEISKKPELRRSKRLKNKREKSKLKSVVFSDPIIEECKLMKKKTINKNSTKQESIYDNMY